MFSPITIPSSTKIPITIIIPNKDNTLIVIPVCVTNINIPKKEIGNPAATQNARRVLRKRDKKSKTNSMPIPPFLRSNTVLSFSGVDWSFEILICMFWCCSLKVLMYSFILVAVPIKSSLLVLLIEIFTADLPLK